MKYKIFFLVDEEKHYLRTEFEEFTARNDIQIVRVDTVCGGDHATVMCIIYYVEGTWARSGFTSPER